MAVDMNMGGRHVHFFSFVLVLCNHNLLYLCPYGRRATCQLQNVPSLFLIVLASKCCLAREEDEDVVLL